MSNEKLSFGDFADLAESIILEEVKDVKAGKKLQLNSAEPEPGQIDISKINLDEHFSSKIVNQCFGGKEEPKPKVVKSNNLKTKKGDDLQIRMQEFVVKFGEMLNEGKLLINEMTTCGMIGVNQGGPIKKKKKLKKKFRYGNF